MNKFIFTLFFLVTMVGNSFAQGDGFVDRFQGAYETGSHIRTMLEIKNVAMALELYRLEHGVYPEANSIQELQVIAGKYWKQAEALGYDKWRQWFLVDSKADGYSISSKGEDQVGAHEFGGAVDTKGHSITMQNGIFVQYWSFVADTARKCEVEIKAIQEKVISSK